MSELGVWRGTDLRSSLAKSMQAALDEFEKDEGRPLSIPKGLAAKLIEFGITGPFTIRSD